MNLQHRGLVTCAALFLFMPATLHADKNDDPNARYKAAMSRNDIEGATAAVCDAAKADPNKWQKKCSAAQQYAADQLKSYDPLYTSGMAAYQRGDYPAAARDLGKIYFGPHHEEAQRLSHDAATKPQQIIDSRAAFVAAQAAYDSGDFTTAAASARKVTVPDMHAMAQQILNNISTYQSNMAGGEAALQRYRDAGGSPAAKSNLAEAHQKFDFALKIKANGPGDPSAKLKEVNGLIDRAAQQAAVADPTPQPGAGPSSNDPKLKKALKDARAAESRKNFALASAAYDRVLAIDPRQPDALAGKQRLSTQSKLPLPPKADVPLPPKPEPIVPVRADETSLTTAIRSFYSSHLAEAGDALAVYLKAGDGRYKGAAHFYLGATFAAKSLLAPSPSEQTQLRQNALQEFQLARAEHYNPVELLISPRILALWKQSLAS